MGARGRVLSCVLAGLGSLGTLVGASASAADPVGGWTPISSLRVEGAQLVAADGAPLELYGVNRSGSEYACVQGTSVFDGPTGPHVVAEMRTWAVDVVRVPLNEDCWLGVNVPAVKSGAVYRDAIVGYVTRLRAAGFAVILDLHWSAPGAEVAGGQSEMPDASHTPAFWQSVARAFRDTSGVAFELFNEPHDVSWGCWANGCRTAAGWRAAGMQSLIDVIRRTGATQPIIVDGLGWGNNLFGWERHRLVDPLHQLVAAFHVYPWSGCVSSTCWRASVGAVAKTTPVIATEVGEEDCTATFVRTFLHWAHDHGVSALVWTWDDNQDCLSLLRSDDGAPTAYGAGVRAILRDFNH